MLWFSLWLSKNKTFGSACLSCMLNLIFRQMQWGRRSKSAPLPNLWGISGQFLPCLRFPEEPAQQNGANRVVRVQQKKVLARPVFSLFPPPPLTTSSAVECWRNDGCCRHANQRQKFGIPCHPWLLAERKCMLTDDGDFQPCRGTTCKTENCSSFVWTGTEYFVFFLIECKKLWSKFAKEQIVISCLFIISFLN